MVLILNYGMGNIGSISQALEHLKISYEFSADPLAIERADRLILAGVGSFDYGMQQLSERGLIPLLQKKVIEQQTPLLGLCLGLQLLGTGSEEGTRPGLGWINASTVRFRPDPSEKIPHMGWNSIAVQKKHPLIHSIDDAARFYFMHAYHLVCADQNDVVATTVYGEKFPSVIAHNSMMGVQFHPEKSHNNGLTLLSNFVHNV